MDETATLGQLVEVLGPSVADVLAAPAGLDVAVTEPVVHDAADPPLLHPGDLVFAVGVDARGRDATALVHQAVGAGAAAVMLKVEGPVPDTLIEAVSGTTALIGIPFGMSWATLLRLVRTALAPQARLTDGGDAHAVGDLFAGQRGGRDGGRTGDHRGRAVQRAGLREPGPSDRRVPAADNSRPARTRPPQGPRRSMRSGQRWS